MRSQKLALKLYDTFQSFNVKGEHKGQKNGNNDLPNSFHIMCNKQIPSLLPEVLPYLHRSKPTLQINNHPKV
jgi:hypothetical protein